MRCDGLCAKPEVGTFEPPRGLSVCPAAAELWETRIHTHLPARAPRRLSAIFPGPSVPPHPPRASLSHTSAPLLVSLSSPVAH